MSESKTKASELAKKSGLAVAAGAATFAVSLAASPLAKADVNPFSTTDLGSGYLQLAEGSCGEGKCGEGKCGEKKGKEGKCGEGKCGEGKCGEKKGSEGKCGEGKCGDKKGSEGKCGEGKCGS